MLPSAFFSGLPLSREAERRADSGWVAACLADAAARFVPVWRSRSLIADSEPPRALLWPRAEVASYLDPDAVLLGVDAAGTAHFAVDVSHLEPEAAQRAAGAGRFEDLWREGHRLPPGDAALLAYARGMMTWHRRSRFCGSCGRPTAVFDAGHRRACTGSGCDQPIFPRTDPVVIMLVTGEVGGEPAVLLGRQPRWPEGMYSALAGFVEPGEALEEAVAREVREEVGVTVAEVAYRGSQPWPFPANLMLGFTAQAVTADIRIDPAELEDARWFTRADLAARRDSGLVLPRRHAIARMLIEDWRAGGSDTGGSQWT